MAAGGETYLLQMVMQLKDQLTYPLDKIGKELNAFGRSMKELRDSSSELIAPLAAPFTLLAGAGAFSISKAITSYTELADTLDKTSIRTGVAAESLQALHFGAMQSGMSAEDMDKALIKLTSEMSKAATGQNANLAAIFKHLGINLRDSKGHVRSAADVMNNLAQAVKNNESPAARMQILNAAFGEELGARLIPLLQSGAEGLAEYKKQAEELGLVMSSEEIQKAAEFGDRLSLVKMASDSVSVAIGAKLRPVLDELIEPMLQIIVANRDWIATQIGEFVQEFAAYLKSIDWKQTLENLKMVLRGFGSFIESIGGANTILIVLGGLIGGSFIVKLVTLGKAIKDVVLAVRLLTVALMANPFIAIATAIVAIISYVITMKGWWGIVFEYAFKWAGVLFDAIKTGVKNAVEAFWTLLWPLRKIGGLLLDIGSKIFDWGKKKWFSDISDGAKEATDNVKELQKNMNLQEGARGVASVPSTAYGAGVPNVPAWATSPPPAKANVAMELKVTAEKGTAASIASIRNDSPGALTTRLSYEGI